MHTPQTQHIKEIPLVQIMQGIWKTPNKGMSRKTEYLAHKNSPSKNKNTRDQALH